MDTLKPAPVALMSPQPGLLRGRKLIRLVGLVALPLGVLALASLAAWAIVWACADLRVGIDPLLPEQLRPRLTLYELALRGIAVDILRQVLIAVFVLGFAFWNDGAAWPRRLGLGKPAEPRRPIAPLWALGLLLVWPLIHIGWVAATAEALHVSFGRGVRLSPYMTPTLIACWLAHVTLLAPIAEEMLIRGETFARASRFLGPAAAIASTAILFCCLHVSEMGAARPLTLVPLAVTLGWLRWRTGRLWPCILLHAWSNTALVAYLLWPGMG